MIQQPELGKRIADLRKAKGLTQEELVEKCNLSVRTLQRIEAGEVIPRPYTIKLIFEALEVPFDQTMKDKGLIIKWLEQFYISFIDLFNLKTNRMKKISILSIMFLGIILGIFAVNGKLNAQNDKMNSHLNANSYSDKNKSSQLEFAKFSCTTSFDIKDEKIARDADFIINGVTLKVNLIVLNMKSGEFNAGFVAGELFPNKIELRCARVMVNDMSIKYIAENVEKSKDKILLKGNAKLTFENESIEANEIIVFLE